MAHFEDLSVRVLLENVSNGHVQWRVLDTEILAIRVIARHGAHEQRRVISFSINTQSVLSLQMIGLSVVNGVVWLTLEVADADRLCADRSAAHANILGVASRVGVFTQTFDRAICSGRHLDNQATA